MFNQEQREIVRNVVWPITKENIDRVTDNTLLYTRKEPNKTWKEDDEDEEDYPDEEEFTRLSLEEYDDLPINDKHIYLDRLAHYFDFDPELKTPSEYRRMTEKEKAAYHEELRWMASPEFETYLKYDDPDNGEDDFDWEEEDFDEEEEEEKEDFDEEEEEEEKEDFDEEEEEEEENEDFDEEEEGDEDPVMELLTE